MILLYLGDLWPRVERVKAKNLQPVSERTGRKISILWIDLSQLKRPQNSNNASGQQTSVDPEVLNHFHREWLQISVLNEDLSVKQGADLQTNCGSTLHTRTRWKIFRGCAENDARRIINRPAQIFEAQELLKQTVSTYVTSTKIPWIQDQSNCLRCANQYKHPYHLPRHNHDLHTMKTAFHISNGLPDRATSGNKGWFQADCLRRNKSREGNPICVVLYRQQTTASSIPKHAAP